LPEYLHSAQENNNRDLTCCTALAPCFGFGTARFFFGGSSDICSENSAGSSSLGLHATTFKKFATPSNLEHHGLQQINLNLKNDAYIYLAHLNA
jgi:hypothetical protein